MKHAFVAPALLLPLALVACGANDQSETLAEPTLATSAPSPTTTTEGSSISTGVDESASEAPSAEPSSQASTVVTITTTEQAEPALGPCDPSAFALEGPTGTLVSYCDGEWARVGKAQTDYVVFAKWDGSQWVRLRGQGETLAGTWCYDHDYWLKQGAPAELVEKLYPCT